jgi:hypothetical protein
MSATLDQTDNDWIFRGIDVSVIFKRGLSDALKTLKHGGQDVDIIYHEGAEIPIRWHECHDPPIRFISKRKDHLYRHGKQWMVSCLRLNSHVILRPAGFNLDEPMIFLSQCLRDKEEIERADFLREIMDMLATDERRYQLSLHVDKLFDSEVTWDEFCLTVMDVLNLEPDARADTIGPGRYIHDIIIYLGDTHHNLIHRWRRA